MTRSQRNKLLAVKSGASIKRNTEDNSWSVRLGDGTYLNYNGGVSEDHAWLVCLPDYFSNRSEAIGLVIDVIAGDEQRENEFVKHLNARLLVYADSEDAPMVCLNDVVILTAPPEFVAESVGLALGLWTEE